MVDNESISQMMNLLNQPYVEGSRVRMMPDIHAGAGCTIGTTMTIKDKICPRFENLEVFYRITGRIFLRGPSLFILF